MYGALNQNHNPNYGRPVLCSTFVAKLVVKQKTQTTNLKRNYNYVLSVSKHFVDPQAEHQK